MMHAARRICVVVLLMNGFLSTAVGQDDRAGTRVLWTTSRIHGTPDPASPYRTRVAFPHLRFQEPLAAAVAPGTDRLFVAERFGKIYAFRNRPGVREKELFLELDKTIYGMAFHPDFAENGFVFVTYVDTGEEVEDGTKVSRFQATATDGWKCDPRSERQVITWPSGGHNGGCLKFGPDGLLYIATGDSSGIADEKLTGQDLRNLSGAILRIDVDRSEDGRPYAVPSDNPFVDTPGARPEIWAYGLRQPWKMSFDRHGRLWTGNVGQDLWEQIYLVRRGGNYGWSVMEGSHPFRPERPRGPTPILLPVVEHDHAEFRSITGGFVYEGQRLPELRGAYLYGDYDTGKIWMFRYDAQSDQVRDHRELVDSTIRLVGFVQDRAGEVYLIDHMGGQLHQLEPNPVQRRPDFPNRLSDTGLFASVRDHQVAPGVLAYDVTAPQWLDGATKERFLALPGESKIEFDGITYPQPAPGAPHGWKFPDGTVAMETISMEMETGDPSSRRRLETRILHYEQLDGSEEIGDQFWRGYTYVWNDAQNDATLVDAAGDDVRLSIRDANAPGGTRQQTWRLPSRAECTVCHNMAAKYVLGINTLQLNRPFGHGAEAGNQIDTFARLGLFNAPVPPAAELPRLVDYRRSEETLEHRARAYLHANCSHCHRKWGGGNGEFRLLATIARDDMGIVDVKPAHGGFYIPGARVVAPQDPARSVLLYRMAKLGPGRMPRLGSNHVDTDGLQLLAEWIRGVPGAARVEARRTVDAAIRRLEAGEAVDDRQLAAVLSTTSGALALVNAIDQDRLRPAVQQRAVALGTSDQRAEIRDLFERFLPEEERTQRLGNAIEPSAILALPGNAERGRALFFTASGVQCRNCHRIQGKGTELGPDLSQVGKKMDARRMLDNILNPSREIEPEFRTYLVQTVNGQVHTGLLADRGEQTVVLKDAQNKAVRIPADEIVELVAQQRSLMPDLLLRDMTAEQVADLLAFLLSLK